MSMGFLSSLPTVHTSFTSVVAGKMNLIAYLLRSNQIGAIL